MVSNIRELYKFFHEFSTDILNSASCKIHFSQDIKRFKKIINELRAKNNFKDGDGRKQCLLFGDHTTYSKDPLVQLEARKSSIKYLFKDLFDEIKGFKYHITYISNIIYGLFCLYIRWKI